MGLFVYHMTCSLNALFPQGLLEQALAMQNLSDQRNAALLLISSLFCNAPINVKPEGGTPGICGAFDLFCLPHPREFDLESGPQGGESLISVAQGAFRFCIRLRK